MKKKVDEGSERYRALCSSYSVPVFHQPWWLDAVCEHWVGVTVEGNHGIGIWPIPLEQKLGVRMTRSPALTAYLGPVMLSSVGYSAAIPKDLLKELIDKLPKLPVWNIAAQPHSWQTEVFQQAGLTVGTRPTYLLQLSDKSEEELFSGLQSEARRKVRRAGEQLTIANEPQAAAEMFALQQATLNRKGTRAYHSAEHFAQLVTIAHGHGAGALWTARADGKIVGAQWSIWDARSCYNMGLARDERIGNKLSSTALIWNAIANARAKGIAVFDFEGSSIPSIAEFFASFGSTRHSYLTLQKNTSLVWRLVRALRP